MVQLNPEDQQNRTSSNQSGSSSRRTGALRNFLEALEILLLAGILYFGIDAITARIRVDGVSMLPSLRTGEFIVVNRMAYKLGDPRHGDVIVFKFPRDPSQEFIKRVIGLPGEKVIIMHGNVRINDQLMEESYIAAPPGYQGEWVIPQGSVFVLGDNRNNSSDSHNWGTVPFEDIIGKAVFVYWPPSEWGRIDSPSVAHAGN